MGVVLRAYDPQLDRKVAVKLLRTSGLSARDAAGLRSRLLREAQAMARLSHPNVLPVHDSGQHGDQVFVAMELVDGSTLREWMGAKRRLRRQILAAFVSAGRGLAAAHQAGLVHRDFKPDNVLVGRDGRVCVTDFGLAQADLGAAVVRGKVAVDAPLTRTGLLAGTPAYMAPEQLRGERVDARSDQFA